MQKLEDILDGRTIIASEMQINKNSSITIYGEI
jgi:hypothetical protein